jgi:hypothetical protein
MPQFSHVVARRSLFAVVIACAAFLLPSHTARADEEGDESFLALPTTETVLETLRPEHPRVLATADDFAYLARAIEADPLMQRGFAKIQQDAAKMIDEPVCTYRIPDGKRLLFVSREVRGRVLTLALVDRLTDSPTCRERLWRDLEAAANFKDWNPSHFLDTAEMTFAFGIAYDWLYDRWTDEQRAVLRDAIVRHGLTPGMTAYRGEAGYGWWRGTTNNWNQVCNGGLAVGALAIADEEPELAAEILSRGLRSLRIAMREFAPDGGCVEGPAYWGYATQYNVPHLAALETALGTDFGFSNYPGFDRTGEFPIHVLGPAGRTFNYADGRDGVIRAPQLYWLAARFGRPDFAGYQDVRAVPLPLDLIYRAAWLRGRDAVTGAPTDPPLDRLFERIQIATMRSAWDDPNASFVGVKAGQAVASHSHLDLGSFVFDALGERWASDLGSDNYNMPGYFGGARHTYYRMRAEGHNTLVINPSGGEDQHPRSRATVELVRTTPGEAVAVVDLTAAYQPLVTRAERTFRLTSNRRDLIIEDVVDTDEPIELWWFMHTQADVEVAPGDAHLALLSRNGTHVRVRLVEPDDAAFEVMDARPLPTSPDPEMQNRNASYRKLAVHLDGVERVRIIVAIEPVREEPDHDR